MLSELSTRGRVDHLQPRRRDYIEVDQLVPHVVVKFVFLAVGDQALLRLHQGTAKAYEDFLCFIKDWHLIHLWLLPGRGCIFLARDGRRSQSCSVDFHIYCLHCDAILDFQIGFIYDETQDCDRGTWPLIDVREDILLDLSHFISELLPHFIFTDLTSLAASLCNLLLVTLHFVDD